MLVLGFALIAMTFAHAVSAKRWVWAAVLSLTLAPLFLSYAGLVIAVVACGSYVLATRLHSTDQPEGKQRSGERPISDGSVSHEARASTTARRRPWIVLLGFLLLAAVLAVPSVVAVGERGGDDCFREFEERFPSRISSVKVEGWSWRPYGVRCTIGRDDGTTVQIVAHPYW